jgi:hypothetical protein
MALGLLPGDRHYYHRSRPGAPLWAACEAEMLRLRVTQGQAHRTRLDESESLTPEQARGLKPCPACWPKEAD